MLSVALGAGGVNVEAVHTVNARPMARGVMVCRIALPNLAVADNTTVLVKLQSTDFGR